MVGDCVECFRGESIGESAVSAVAEGRVLPAVIVLPDDVAEVVAAVIIDPHPVIFECVAEHHGISIVAGQLGDEDVPSGSPSRNESIGDDPCEVADLNGSAVFVDNAGVDGVVDIGNILVGKGALRLPIAAVSEGKE